MKNNSIMVVYHSGKEDLKELMTKIVLAKITNEQKLRKYYNNGIHATTIPTEKQE